LEDRLVPWRTAWIRQNAPTATRLSQNGKTAPAGFSEQAAKISQRPQIKLKTGTLLTTVAGHSFKGISMSLVD
jgi:hypothetical protein